MLKQKQLIVAAVVVLILLLGGGFFLFSQNKNSQTKTITTENTVNPSTAEKQNAMSSLVDLLASGQSTQCAFDVSQETGGDTKGTIYISAGKMRGDFTITDKDGKESSMNMIRVDDQSYMWGGALPNGIKMKLSTEDLKTNTQANQYINLNTKTDYKCTPWVVDSSKFSVPTNIKFTDLSSMMPKTTGTSGQSNSSPCASITDPTTKTACENAIQNQGQ